MFEPLGWDWRVSSAVIAGFPAREVVIAVLGTVYAVGDEADEGNVVGPSKGRDQARWFTGVYAADGRWAVDFLRLLPAVRSYPGDHQA